MGLRKKIESSKERRDKELRVTNVWCSGDLRKLLELVANEMSLNGNVDKSKCPVTERLRQRYQSDSSQRGKTIHCDRNTQLLKSPTKHHSQLIHKTSKTLTFCQLTDNVKQLCGGSTLK